MSYTIRSGKILTDEDIERLADEAERGYDVEHLIRRVAREEAQKVLDEHIEKKQHDDMIRAQFDDWRNE